MGNGLFVVVVVVVVGVVIGDVVVVRLDNEVMKLEVPEEVADVDAV